MKDEMFPRILEQRFPLPDVAVSDGATVLTSRLSEAMVWFMNLPGMPDIKTMIFLNQSSDEL